MNTTESNKLIAEFMGYEQKIPDHYSVPYLKGIHKGSFRQFPYWDLQFDDSWDWLMPVVEKIESLPREICNEYFWNTDDSKRHEDFVMFRVSKIGDLHEKVCEFIKWHNEKSRD